MARCMHVVLESRVKYSANKMQGLDRELARSTPGFPIQDVHLTL